MSGQRIGYVRGSAAWTRTLAGSSKVWGWTGSSRTRPSGKDAKRPQLEELLRFSRVGDTVFVHSMDRQARNLDDLRSLVQERTKKGVRIEFLKENLVFTGED